MSRLSLYRTGWEKGLRARRKRVMKAKGKIGEGGGYKLWAGPSSVCVSGPFPTFRAFGWTGNRGGIW